MVQPPFSPQDPHLPAGGGPPVPQVCSQGWDSRTPDQTQACPRAPAGLSLASRRGDSVAGQAGGEGGGQGRPGVGGVQAEGHPEAGSGAGGGELCSCCCEWAAASSFQEGAPTPASQMSAGVRVRVRLRPPPDHRALGGVWGSPQRTRQRTDEKRQAGTAEGEGGRAAGGRQSESLGWVTGTDRDPRRLPGAPPTQGSLHLGG